MRRALWFGTANRCGRALAIATIVPALAIAGGAVAWLLLRSTPEKTVAQYLAYAKAGDQQKVKTLVSAETLKASAELEKTMASQFGGMVGGTSLLTEMAPTRHMDLEVKVGKAEVKGKLATVPVTYKPKGNVGIMAKAFDRPMPVKCVKEGWRWKVDYADELKMSQQFMGQFAPAVKDSLAKAFAGGMSDALKKMGTPGGAASPPDTPASGTTGAASAAELVQQGITAKRAGNLAQAAATFADAIKADAGNCDAHWGLAWVLVDQGKKQEARAHFEQVSELATDSKMRDEAKAALGRIK